MKVHFKKIFHHRFLRTFLVKLTWLYLRFVYLTSPWKFVGKTKIQEVLDDQKPLIICFWHGRMAMNPFAWQWNKPFSILLSKHRDGNFIRDVLKCFNINSIEGSTNRGGALAAVKMIKALKSGIVVGITPDGPRGPHEEISLGIATLAKNARACIIAISFSQKRTKKLKTWDHFCLPIPFSRGSFFASDYIDTAFCDYEDSELQNKIKLLLETVTQEAESYAKNA